jgi:hypothetical protein
LNILTSFRRNNALFLRSATGDYRSAPGTTGTGTYRHIPALTGLDRHKTGTDRPGLFYDVFDTHFVLNSPKRYNNLKFLIKNVIKKPGPVGVGPVRSGPVCADLGWSVPVGAGWCRFVPVGAGGGTGSPRCRPSPTGAGAGAADRPQETLYIHFPSNKMREKMNYFLISLNHPI